jgi:hypothetical protein
VTSPAEASTEKIRRRQSVGDLVQTWLPLPVVVWLLVTLGPMVWWVANQARDIQDARRVAEESKAQVAICTTEARAISDRVMATQISEREILTKLAAIEAQLAELRTLMLRRGP